MLDVAAFVDSLKYLGYGLGGIFVIIGLLALMVVALRKIFPAK